MSEGKLKRQVNQLKQQLNSQMNSVAGNSDKYARELE